MRRSAFALVLVAVAACLLGAAIGPTRAEAAAPPLLREFCPAGTGAGQCNAPRGVAVDPASGNVYVADVENERVQEFTAWGELIRAWGWDVVASGPGDDTVAPEDQFEVCVPAEGDVCKAGVSGGGKGQLLSPEGIAMDSVGDVYVAEGDFSGRRVQKFHPTAGGVEFVLMFGGDVNKTKVEEGAPEAQRNLCTEASGDECQAGTEGTGNGQFGLFMAGSFIAASADGETIYVGDTNRIEEFDSGGHYLGNLPDPDELLKKEGMVNSLAVDPADGSIYVGFFRTFAAAPLSKPNVHKLSPAGEELCQIKAHGPAAVTVGPGGKVYLVDEFIGSEGVPREVVRFDSKCEKEEVLFKESLLTKAENEFSADPTGIATSSACGIKGSDLLIANPDGNNSFVKLFGPPPDPKICPQPEVPPVIEDQYAFSVGSSSATVRATINPRFWPDTRYYMEYGTGKCSEGGCEATQPLPPGSLLTDEVQNNPTNASVPLSGLEPARTYHFRFVASSGGGGPVFGNEATFITYPPPPAMTACSNQGLRSGASAQLPDCRAYEMVSPVDKSNGDIAIDEIFDEFEPGNFQLVPPDGERATYSSFRSFASPQGAPLFSQYLSSRDPEAGWLSHSISPARTSVPFYLAKEPANTRQFKAFSPDLCKGWLIQDTTHVLAPGSPPGVPNIDRRDDRDCGPEGYDLVTPVPPPGFSGAEIGNGSAYYPTVQGITADSNQTLLRADAALTADACKTTPEEGRGIFQVYLQVAGEPEPHLVSLLPNGKAACVHSSAGTGQGLVGSSSEDSVYHALSEDGSRVFWSASASPDSQKPVEGGSGDNAGPLYLRVDPAAPKSTISGSKCTEAGKACTYKVSELVSKEPARFWMASPDGSRALFSLDPDGSGAASSTLYEFSGEPGEDGLLKTEATPIADGFLGVMGASADLGRVYFVSTKALGGGQNSAGEEATGGQPNLYLDERGGGLVFIGTLSGLDVHNPALHFALPSPIAALPSRRTARVSADGLHAVFTSAAPLTGYENADALSGEADAEVFLYDAAEGGSGQLACVSCNPSGARPRGQVAFPDESGEGLIWQAARIPGWESEFYPSRALSANGSRIFFESYEGLVLRDTNGKRDTYEWERAGGEKECEEVGAELYVASSGGCISLISSGKSALNSEFLDASASGSDAFFITGSSLLPQDYGLLDVYDARVGGGFPPAPPPAPPCEGEACQPAPAPPESASPASSTFQGEGNVPPPAKPKRCGKGKHRVVHGGKQRCVKEKKRKHRRAAR